MKGKTKLAMPISPNCMMTAGTEFEVVGENGDFYSCRLLTTGDIVCLHKNNVIITDYTPLINWEQRRYELAKAAMQGLCRLNDTYEQIAEYAVKQADALIEELKK